MNPEEWLASLDMDERERKELDFALLYNAAYSHGTPGHLTMTVLAKVALKYKELYDSLNTVTVGTFCSCDKFVGESLECEQCGGLLF